MILCLSTINPYSVKKNNTFAATILLPISVCIMYAQSMTVAPFGRFLICKSYKTDQLVASQGAKKKNPLHVKQYQSFTSPLGVNTKTRLPRRSLVMVSTNSLEVMFPTNSSCHSLIALSQPIWKEKQRDDHVKLQMTGNLLKKLNIKYQAFINYTLRATLALLRLTVLLLKLLPFGIVCFTKPLTNTFPLQWAAIPLSAIKSISSVLIYQPHFNQHRNKQLINMSKDARKN